MTIAATATDRWTEALDEFEAALEAVAAMAATIQAGGADLPAVPAMALPPDLGPLPASLGLRVQELATRSQLIEQELTRLRDDIADQLKATSTTGRGSAVYSSTNGHASRLDEVG